MAKFTAGNQAAKGRRPRRPLLTVSEAQAMKAHVRPHLPTILDQLIGKAKEGDLPATKLLLDRVWPIQTAVSEELQSQLDELKKFISERDASVVSR